MRSLHQLGSRGVAITSRLRGDSERQWECCGWSRARIEIGRVPCPITGCSRSPICRPLISRHSLPHGADKSFDPLSPERWDRFNKKWTRYSAPSRRTWADSPHRRIRLFVGTRYQNLSSREHAGWKERADMSQRKGNVAV